MKTQSLNFKRASKRLYKNSFVKVFLKLRKIFRIQLLRFRGKPSMDHLKVDQCSDNPSQSSLNYLGKPFWNKIFREFQERLDLDIQYLLVVIIIIMLNKSSFRTYGVFRR